MSRKDREREAHRQEILAAAERLIARKGYRATTMDEIARETEFAVGTLYTLFKDKDELYTRIVEGFAVALVTQFERDVLPLADPRAAVAALIETRLRHYYAHRDFIRQALEASPVLRYDPMAAAPGHLIEIHEGYMAQVTALCARGVAEGVFPHADPHFLALALEGTMHAHVAYWSRHEPTEPLEVLVERLKQQFVALVTQACPAAGRASAPSLPPSGEPR
jgi:AcrR family transcriptional regulator